MKCEVHVDGIHLEHVSEFKYLGCVLDKAGTDGAECSRKVASERRVAGICSLCVLVLYETLLVPVLTYGSETILWKEKERSKIMAVRMDNSRGLLGIRRMDRVLNAWIRELCGVRKGLMKASYDGSAIWRGWGEMGSPRESM